MTVARWFGTGLLDRYGRIPLLRGSVGASALGLLLVVFGQNLPLAIVGAAIWGLGTALGFPVGMSAAADDPAHAAARVSVIASIGYVAFLASPPVIGLLGNHIGVRHALTATVGVLALGLLASSACRPLADHDRSTTPALAEPPDSPGPAAGARTPTLPDSTTTPGPWTRRPPETTPDQRSHPRVTITTENDPATHQLPTSQPKKGRD